MRIEGVRWSRISEREKLFCVRSFRSDRETDLGGQRKATQVITVMVLL